MKKLLISTAVLALLLGACSQTEIHFADPADVAAVSSAQNTESPDEAAEPAISEVETAESSPAEAAAYEADAEALPLNAPAEAVQEKSRGTACRPGSHGGIPGIHGPGCRIQCQPVLRRYPV